jgi:hypothetical protein
MEKAVSVNIEHRQGEEEALHPPYKCRTLADKVCGRNET